MLYGLNVYMSDRDGQSGGRSSQVGQLAPGLSRMSETSPSLHMADMALSALISHPTFF